MRGETPPGAFSLLEVLIAVSLLAMLATLLFLILDATSRLWRENERRVDSYREARAALNLISRELKSAFRLDPLLARSFLINPSPSDGVALPSAAAETEVADSIWFTALLPRKLQDPEKNKSDLCAIGYFLAWTPNPGSLGGSSYKLFRYMKSSDDTFADLSSGHGTLFSGVSATVNAQNDILARNILSIRFRAFRTDTSGVLTRLSDSELLPPSNRFPDLVEIEIRAINTETAARLSTREEWENPSSPIVRQGEQVFTTRVKLPARAPAP